MASVPWSTASAGGELPSWIAPRDSDPGHTSDAADLECFRPTPLPPVALLGAPACGGPPSAAVGGDPRSRAESAASEIDALRAERDRLRAENEALRAELRHLVAGRDGLAAERDELLRERSALVPAVGALRRAVLEASEGELVRLSLVVAERIVHHEVSIAPAVVGRWARVCVDALGAGDAYSLSVSPELEQLVPPSAWTDAHGVARQPLVDGALSGLSCRVRTEFGNIEVGLRARLAAVANALGLEGLEQP